MKLSMERNEVTGHICAPACGREFLCRTNGRGICFATRPTRAKGVKMSKNKVGSIFFSAAGHFACDPRLRARITKPPLIELRAWQTGESRAGARNWLRSQ